MGPPEIKTPHPSELGGEKGIRGETSPVGRQEDISESSVRKSEFVAQSVDSVERQGDPVEQTRRNVPAGSRRSLRFAIQRHAQHLLTVDAKANHPGKFPSDVWRTTGCLWSRIGDVQIHKSLEHGTAHYSGLFTCGSVWACPCCAAKIQERRREEIELAMQRAKISGFIAIMPTFTFPHGFGDDLATLLSRQKRAFELLRQTRGYRRVKDALKLKGIIRSLEITHGANGWHPHTHELWFVRVCDESKVRDELAKLWQRACISAGLCDETDEKQMRAFFEHSVHVMANVTAGDYLAKQDDSRRWGMAEEVAKATSKLGRAKGCHPHEFLVRGASGDDRRFLEYVKATKGKQQLRWSPGLKEWACVVDKSDEEIAQESIDRAALICDLSREQWNVVRGNDARAEVLEAAETGGADAVAKLLGALGYVEEISERDAVHLEPAGGRPLVFRSSLSSAAADQDHQPQTPERPQASEAERRRLCGNADAPDWPACRSGGIEDRCPPPLLRDLSRPQRVQAPD